MDCFLLQCCFQKGAACGRCVVVGTTALQSRAAPAVVRSCRQQTYGLWEAMSCCFPCLGYGAFEALGLSRMLASMILALGSASTKRKAHLEGLRRLVGTPAGQVHALSQLSRKLHVRVSPRVLLGVHQIHKDLRPAQAVWRFGLCKL